MLKRIPKKVLHLILWLFLGSTMLSLGIRSWIDRKYKEYEAAQVKTEEETEAAVRDLFETGPQLLFADEPFIDAEDTVQSRRETLRAEIDALYQETERMQAGQTGREEREKSEQAAELWDTEMKSLADAVSERMSETARLSFMEEQSRFLRMRNHEAMKELGQQKSGVRENTDYMKRYAALTHERCLEILRKYERYLD